MNIQLFYETVILCLMAAASPGPNFFMTVANTTESGRVAGIMTAFGVTLGVTFWLILCGFGLSFVIVGNPFIQNFLNIAVVIFLIYLGWRIIKNRNIRPVESKIIIEKSGMWNFFKIGLIGTVLNGGVGVFYAAIFSKIITEYGYNYKMIIMHITVFNAIELFWYFFVAIGVSYASKFMNRNYAMVNLCLGVTMLYFAIQIAFDFILK